MFNNPYINTFSSGISESFFSINYASSFPRIKTALKNQNPSTSNALNKTYPKNKREIFSYKYTIALDWLQFVCVPNDERFSMEQIPHPDVIIDKVIMHHNPNFYYCYRIIYKGIEMCDIYMYPTNENYKASELLIKISNHLLYTQDWSDQVEYLLHLLSLKIARFNHLDIAVDSVSNIKICESCRGYFRNRTIQINNEALMITPKDFKKKTLMWNMYTIGSKSSEKFARVYNKSQEIKYSGKEYILDFWHLNGLEKENVYRFEISLGWKILKMYPSLSLKDLSKPEILSELLEKEVRKWLIFKYVKLEFLRNHRKEHAFNKGTERPLFKWNRLPKQINYLTKVPVAPRKRNEAKRSITFSLGKVREDPACSTTMDYVKVIKTTAGDFDLVDWMNVKIDYMFRKNGIDPIPIFSGGTSIT